MFDYHRQGSQQGKKKFPKFRGRRRRSEFHVALWVFLFLKCLQNPPEQLLINPRGRGNMGLMQPGRLQVLLELLGLKIDQREAEPSNESFLHTKTFNKRAQLHLKWLCPWRVISIWVV